MGLSQSLELFMEEKARKASVRQVPSPDSHALEAIAEIYATGRELCFLILHRQQTGEPFDEYATLLRRAEAVRQDWLELWQPTDAQGNRPN